MRVSRRYLTAIVLLAVFAVGFGVFGTVAPPLAEESGSAPELESSSESVGHFQNPPSYDSGWVDISSKCGQYVSLNHGLNTTDVVVDVSGKVSLDPMGGAIEWTRTYGGTGSDYAQSLILTDDGGYALAGYTESYGAGDADFWLVKTDAAGSVQWNKTYGTAYSENARAVIQTSDGGYALAGYAHPNSTFDFWLVKTDSAGNMMWNQTYEGTNNDGAYSVVETSDGGYALAGYTYSYGAGNADFWLVKTDSAGNMMWNQTYGGTNQDRAHSVVETSDGGYALAGFTYSYGAGTPTYRNFWLVKTDSAGNMQWSRAYKGPGFDNFAYSLVQTGDEGYALAGTTGPAFWLVKTDLAGNAQWNKTYGLAAVGDDFAYSLIETGDGGYALAGYTYSYGAGGSDFWLVKTDGVGNMEWSRAYGGVWNDCAYSVVETSDGGYALAGYTNSFGAGTDFWLVKITGEMNVGHRRNFSGANLIVGWSRTYGGTGEDAVHSLIRTSDGGYAIAGYTRSYGAGNRDFWLVKTDASGTLQWDRTYGGANEDFAESVVQTSDGGYAIAGYTHSYGAGGSDFWLVKTDSAGNMMWNQTYGGAYNDYAVSVVQTVDRGYAIVGYTYSYGTGTPTYSNFWFIKTDSVGNMEWNRIFGEMYYDFGSSVIQTSDGGYAMAGNLLSYSAPFWLLKTDTWGIPQWNKTYGTDAFAVSVIETGDGGYALAGYTSPYGVSGNDFYLVKTDSVGTLQWNKTYGRAGRDVACSVVQTSDGGYALAGYTNSSGAGGHDFWLVRTDAFGVTQWSRTYGGTSDDYAYSLVQTSDGGYAIAGQTNSYGAGGGDFWLVKSDVESGLAQTGLTDNSITLYRGSTDLYWNYVRVRMWLIQEPSWIYGDINMDGVVDNKDLYIIGRNYGQTFSLLSLTGIIAVAGIHTVKKRKQTKQPSYIS